MALELKIKDGEFIFNGRSMQITKDKNKLLKPHGKQLYNYGIVLELNPSEEQKTRINQIVGCARFVHNRFLEERINLYKEEKKSLPSSEYKKHGFKKLKEENPWLKEADSTALASAMENVDTAYGNFFKGLREGRKCGFPKPWGKAKPNGCSYTSKCINGNIRIEGNIIKLPKIGDVRFFIPKGERFRYGIIPDNGRITSIVVSNYGNRYTVSVQIETIIDLINPVSSVMKKNIWSADMGVKDFCILGNAEFSEKTANPRWIKLHARRLRILQKRFSKKIKGSNNYKKAKLLLAKEHRKVKNQRKDFHHKLSKYIADNADVFICEDLNIKGMVKNHKLARKISSCGWGQFLEFVKYKLERRGGLFVKVSRWFPSSKTCCHCGHKLDKLDLSVCKWKCPSCGTLHDRDINAQKNILNEGIRLLVEEEGIAVA